MCRCRAVFLDGIGAINHTTDAFVITQDLGELHQSRRCAPWKTKL